MRASRALHRPWLAPPRTDEAFDALLRRMREEPFEPMFVCRRDDGAIVGFFNVSQIIRGPLQSAFLGYGAVATHVGRGYMSEGLELVLAWRDHERWAMHAELWRARERPNPQPANPGSQRSLGR